MKASVNPYYLKDINGGYYNKYPEFQIWEEGRLAGIQEVTEWVGEHKFWFAINGDRAWQAQLKKWGIK